MANLVSIDQVGGKIKVHSGITATVDREFNAPGSVPVPTEATFDGENLISLDWVDGLIFVHDKITAAIIDSFLSPTGNQPIGAAYCDGNLVSGEDWFTKTYIHHGVSAIVDSSFNNPSGWVECLAYDWKTGNLISARFGTGAGAHKIYVHDKITAAVLDSWNTTKANLSGICFDGTNIITQEFDMAGNHFIIIYEGVSSTVKSSFPIYNGICGITVDVYGALATLAGWPYHDWAGD